MPKISNDPKESTIKLRINDEMRRKIELNSRKKNMSMSEYVRNLIVVELRKATNEKSAFETAIMIVRDELLCSQEIYDGFKASIKSALDDIDIEGSKNHEDTAKVILDRIIGKE